MKTHRNPEEDTALGAFLLMILLIAVVILSTFLLFASLKGIPQ